MRAPLGSRLLRLAAVLVALAVATGLALRLRDRREAVLAQGPAGERPGATGAAGTSAGGGAGSAAGGPAAPGPRGPAGGRPPAPVVVAPIVEESVRDRLEIVGTVEADVSTVVSAEVAGLVARRPVDEGARVVAGKTVLVELKSTDREIAAREAKAALARARAQLAELKAGTRKEEVAARRAAVAERRATLAQKERDQRRAQELHAQKIINTAELQRVETEVASARAQVDRAEADLALAEAGPRVEAIAAEEAEVARLAAALERAEDNVARTVVRAPITGYVTRFLVEVGQWVAEGGRVADLVAIDTVFVRVDVNERDIGRVKPGEPATVTADAYPELTFKGVVDRIVPSADPATRGFPVKVRVANGPDRLLKAGMFARVVLESGTPRPALLVPKDAVVTRGAQSLVFLVEDGTARAVTVTVGAARGDRVAVRGPGLAGGGSVVVAGQATLADGAPVAVAQARRPGAPRAAAESGAQGQ